MEIILLERVKNLGLIGDVVSVKPGFGRNYLLPKGKALRATQANIDYFKTQKAHLEADNLKLKKEAEAVAKRMEGLNVVVIRHAGDSGQLYGSVSAKDISEAANLEGYRVDRRQVDLKTPIKMLGLHTAHLVLHPEVEVEVVVNVALSEEEAVMQKERGGAIIPETEKTQQIEADTKPAPKEASAKEDPKASEASSEATPKTKKDGGKDKKVKTPSPVPQKE